MFSSDSSLGTVGGIAVCGGAQLCLAALRVCAERIGVDTGTQHHRQGTHRPAAAATRQGRNAYHTAVLQRVSEMQVIPCIFMKRLEETT